MDISVSNIAWDLSIEEEVFKLLKKQNVNNIDIALSKYFPNIEIVDDKDIYDLKNYFEKSKIKVIGMQSLLFGLDKVNMFNSKSDRKILIEYLSKVFNIAGRLNIKKLVFGSAKNRNISIENKDKTKEIAYEFFNQLGHNAQENNVLICIEPQPMIYDSNYLTNSNEVYTFVNNLNHENVKMQLDIGSMIVNNEDPKLISTYDHKIGHIHISRPYLEPIYLNKFKDDINFAINIRKSLPSYPVTIEMLTKKEKEPLFSIYNSIEYVKKIFK